MKDASLRKYSQSIGEPVDFDFDGTLRDRKLTLAGARAMYEKLAAVVPEITATGPIEIKFAYRKYVQRRGSMVTKRTRNVWTGEVITKRSINLQVHADGNTEKTMLHELAHAAAPVYVHHGPLFGEWCLKLEAIWLDMITRPEAI